MLNKNGEHIYVAELRVPTRFYPSSETRRAIDNPAEFGIIKGYYVIRPPDEQSTVIGYAELILVIEFVSPSLKEAEDHALRVGRVFSSMASAYGGYPLESPYLHRIACIGVDHELKSQHDYCYLDRPYILSEFNQTVGHQFRQYLQSISSVDGKTRHQLQSAIHWYGISISSDDPTVSYVAAWTGLESIGTDIDRRAHPKGPKGHCQTCGNIAGGKRDHKKAGITHMFNRLTGDSLSASLSNEARELLAKELQRNFSARDAQKLRNSIVHGSGEIESLVHESSRSRRHLVHVLSASIQSAMSPYVKSWIPGEYGFHPGARCSFMFKGGLCISPYYGEWAAKFDSKTQPGNQAQGRPYKGVLDVEWHIRESALGFVESESKELFKRNVDIQNLNDGTDVLGLTTWHDRSPEPEWKESTNLARAMDGCSPSSEDL